ncbi:hypothetical protein [Streptomyces sp. NPDC003480]
MPRLSADFVHPARVTLPGRYRLRPITPADSGLGCSAVMGSRERLWSLYGEAWGPPPTAMTHEQDREDLPRHERGTAEHKSSHHALFDDAGTADSASPGTTPAGKGDRP